MNRDNAVVVPIVSDASQFIKGFDEVIKVLNNLKKGSSLKGIDNLNNEMAQLKKTVHDITTQLGDFSPNIDLKDFSVVMAQLKQMQDAITAIQMDKGAQTGAVEKRLQRYSARLEQLSDNINDLESAGERIKNVLTQALHLDVQTQENDAIAKTTQKIETLEQELRVLRDTSQEAWTKMTAKEAVQNMKELTAGITEAQAKFSELSNDYKNRQGLFSEGKDSQSWKQGLQQYKAYLNQLGQLSQKALQLNQVGTSKGWKTFGAVALDDSMIKAFESNVTQAETRLENRLGNLRQSLKETQKEAEAAVTKFEIKDGAIYVPIEPASDAMATMKQAVMEILTAVQDTVTPVTVPIQLVSAYKTNTKKEIADLKEIQELAAAVNQLPEGEVKSNAKSTLAAIQKQFQKELKLDIKTNIDKTYKDINAGIAQIKQTLKQNKLHINAQLSDETKETIKQQIEALQTELKPLNVEGIAEQLADPKITEALAKVKTQFDSITDLSLVKTWGDVILAALDQISAKMTPLVKQMSNVQKAVQKTQEAEKTETKSKAKAEAQAETKSKASKGKKKKEEAVAIDAKEVQKDTQTLERLLALLAQINKTLADIAQKEFKIDTAGIQQAVETLQKAMDKLEKTHQAIKRINTTALSKAKAKSDSELKQQRAEKKISANGQQFIDTGVKQLETAGLSVLSTQLQATKTGVIQLIALVKTADDEFQKYTMESADGVAFSTKKIESETAAILKQAAVWQSLKNAFANASGADSMEFLDSSSELWQSVIKEASDYQDVLGDIIKITRSVRQDNLGQNLESFKILGTKGSVTIGAEMEKVALTQKMDDSAFEQATLHNQQLIQQYQQLGKTSKEYFDLLSKSDSKDITTVQEERLEQLNKQWQEALEHAGQYEILTTGDSAIQQKAEAAYQELSDSFLSSARQYMDNLLSQTIKAIDKARDKFNEKTPTDQQTLLLSQRGQALSTQSSLASMVTDQQSLLETLQLTYKLSQNVQKTIKDASQTTAQTASESSVLKLSTKANKMLGDNTAASKEWREQVQRLVDKLNELADSGEKISKADFNVLANQFFDLGRQLEFTETKGKSLLDMITSRAKGLTSNFFAMYFSMYDLVRYFRQGIQVVHELDDALTEMRKVSDETVESLKNFQSVSYDIADSIGTTALNIQKSAADFMRLGYSLQEASKLAADASIYANVGDMNINEATEHMISSIKAWGSEFKTEVEASSKIIDKYNEIGRFCLNTWKHVEPNVGFCR